MSLKFHIKNTEAAIEAWATVEPEAVSYRLKFFREDWYPFDGPPSCGSAACFAGHLPYFAHFYKLGVRAGKDGTPFLKRQPGLPNHSLSEYLFSDPYLFHMQRGGERGTAHEVVTARLAANLERLLALELGEDDQPRNQK